MSHETKVESACSSDPYKSSVSTLRSSQWIHNWFLSLRCESWLLAWESLPVSASPNVSPKWLSSLSEKSKLIMKTVIPVALLALPIITLAELAQVQVCSNFVTHAEFHFAKKCVYLSEYPTSAICCSNPFIKVRVLFMVSKPFCRWNILEESLSSWRIDALSQLQLRRSPDTISALPMRSFMYVTFSKKCSPHYSLVTDPVCHWQTQDRRQAHSPRVHRHLQRRLLGRVCRQDPRLSLQRPEVNCERKHMQFIFWEKILGLTEREVPLEVSKLTKLWPTDSSEDNSLY